jgi:RHS repeat-associated protein
VNTHRLIALTALLVFNFTTIRTIAQGNEPPTPKENDMEIIPEEPETKATLLNSIKHLSFPDPTEEITVIKMPEASQSGNAALSFPVKLPGGREGMEPEINIQYNSEGGNGWLGLGWDLTINAVTIETRWGVPRYDATLETETYSINGAQLSPVAHRAVPIARTAEKQFHPRVENAFDKIIRHGTNPTNYWWEVTDKGGTINSYGGTASGGVDANAVLKDANGNIAFWALTETRSTNNNFVRYLYVTVMDAGNTGGNTGKDLYLSSITYTGHNTTPGKYTIDFVRNTQLSEPRRTDVSINGNWGFKKVTADLLRKISIKYNGQNIRSYELTYIQGAFYKTLLQNISEYDAAGTLFNTHTFEYYNDVQAGGGGTFTPLSPEQTWQSPNDNVTGDFVTPGTALFNDYASALSGSKTSGKGFGMALTIGPCGDPSTKTNTAGVSFGVAQSSNEGMLALIDINGDRLPDKVFKDGGSLYYRANLSGPDGVLEFGPKRPVNGISNFSQGKNFSDNVGIESHFGIFAGFTKTNSDQITSTYFAEVNGDQLIDIVKNGVVYFNHLDNSGNPTFTTLSDDTPSPVNAAGGIDPNLITQDPAELEQAIDDHPLHDMVKVWTAPFNGTVSITNPVSLIQSADPEFTDDSFRDGVRVSIQVRGTELWYDSIPANDFTPKTPTNVGAIAVAQGDRIYFRVQSQFNGSWDQVLWAPQITYSFHTPGLVDANGLPVYQFTSEQDFNISGKYSTGMAINGAIHIQGTFIKPAITDDLTIQILRKDSNDVDSVVLLQNFAADPSANFPVSIDMPVSKGDHFYFSVFSNTNIDWNALTWEPYLYYTASADPSVTQLYDNNSNPILDFYPTVDFHSFNRLIERSLAWTGSASDTDTVAITPTPGFLSTTESGTLVFSIKKQNQFIAKQFISVIGGSVGSVTTDSIIVFPGEKLYLEYFTDSVHLANQISSTLAHLDTNGTGFDVTCGFHTLDTTFIFGPGYRFWGQFAYNGNRARAQLPIIETDLQLPPSFSNPTSIDLSGVSDPADMQTEYDGDGGSNPKDDKFILLIPDSENKNWRGYDNSSFITKNIFSASRLGKDNLLPPNPVGGSSIAASGALGISKVSETTNMSIAVGIGPGGASVSTGQTKFVYEYKDMNGDGYPDILTDDLIQYTLPFGGLEATARNSFSGEVGISDHSSVGATLGGTWVLSRAANAKPTTRGARAKSAEGDAKISAGFSGDFNYNTDHTVFGWMDINNDGLPDRVHENGTVELNIGYSFLPTEPFGFSSVDEGDETSTGAGLSINLANYSIAAGVGVSRSLTHSKQTLEDVNGDGLLDYIEDINPLRVRINTGNGFASVINWDGAPLINETISTGESANGAFTIGFNFFPCVRVCFNPSAQVSQGVNKNTVQLVDINGDGFPDLLSSDADNNLKTALSTINKTNLLKKVNRPLQANFKIDYKRIGNNYEMPQSKFALSVVTIYDGVPGDGADTMRSSFAYQNGFYNRNEREFYGFSKVITSDLNTRNNNVIYRTHESGYVNDNYYEKGVSLSSLLKNATGNKFTETINTIQLKDIATGTTLPASFKQTDDGAAFPALVNTQKLFYEGQAVAAKSTNVSISYDLFGNVISSTDFGDVGAGDDLTTITTYHSVPAKYIMNIPATINVVSGAQTYRQDATTIDAVTGNVTENRQYLASGDIAKTNKEYDTYGNVTKVTRPQNATGQRLVYNYVYDTDVNTYKTRITDSYGYISSSTYDLRFGNMLSSTDVNGQQTLYTLDNVGRLTTLRGPLEIAAGIPFSISYEYHPEATVPWAAAKHFDASNPGNYIETARFSDGLGREVQSKKDIALYTGPQTADQEVMQVSGANTYDAFSRVDSLYYPVTEAKGTTGVLNPLIDNVRPTLMTYDILDRVLITTRPDLTVTTMEYSFGPDRNATTQFKTKSVDGNGIRTENYTNVRNLLTSIKSQYSQGSDVWTSYDYNAINELVKVTEDMGNQITATYDQMGRKTSLRHPDAGLTTYQYDLNSNPVQVVTANLTSGNGIKYSYDRERLIKITYPNNPQNNVTITYGAPGATDNRAGRILKQVDGTGYQEFSYNALGALIKNKRYIVSTDTIPLTFITEWTYDTWNRFTGMTYPDQEKITYNYNLGGLVKSMSGLKGGISYNYLLKKGYDKFEQRVFMRYGNASEMTYTYEPQRRRLQNHTAKTAAGRVIMDNVFTFDNEDNILRFVNNAPVPPSNLMGGRSDYQYSYDDLYRLTGTTADYRNITHQNRYTLGMSYNTVFSILNKNQLHQFKGLTDLQWSPRNETTYNYNYNYNSVQPHAPIGIGTATYTYDAAGNQTGWNDNVSAQSRTIVWDEENRIKSITDNGQMFRFTYDAAGNRVTKSIGNGQKIKVNGRVVNDTTAGIGNFRIYVNPYQEIRSGSFTKHFYIEGGRIASKYIAGTNPPSNAENFQFYFHSDYVGSSAYVTDRLGEVYQHLEYFPFGETFIHEHGNAERTRYLFNGKEQDEETRLYYYGARYYDYRTSLWESVDPKINKDNNISPYVYCRNNPVKLSDPDGKSAVASLNKGTKTITVTQKLIFYGGEATPQRVAAIKKGLEKQWNSAAAKAKVRVDKSGNVNPKKSKGTEYKVKFVFETEIMKEAEATTAAAKNEKDKNHALNFIRVENGGAGSESFYSVEGADGGNGGWFTTAQPLETSTGAHEIAHGYGYGHNDKFDAKGGATPDITVPIEKTDDHGASRKVTSQQVEYILRGGFDMNNLLNIGTNTNPIYDKTGKQLYGHGKSSEGK